MSEAKIDRVDAAVSYSRADQARVEPILTALRNRGLTVWFDKDIPGGALWEEIIARKYRASGALLFFVSRASLSSQRCSEEVSTARTLGKPIIPVLMDPLTLPDDLPDRFVLTLQARNTVDVVERSPAEAEAVILHALEGFGIAPGAPPPPSQPLPPSRPRHPATPPAAAAKPSLPSQRSSVKWIAFGGAAFAVLVVAAAGFFLTRPTPDGTRMQPASDGGAPATATPRPASPADPTEVAAAAPSQPATPGTPSAPPAAAPELGAPAVTLSAPSFAVGIPVTLSFADMPGGQQDMIAIAKAGDPPSKMVAYVYTQGAKAKDLKLKPVMAEGAYEVRVFYEADVKAGVDDKVRLTVPFTVTAAAPVTLTLTQPSFVEGHPIKIGYAGMPGNERDWVSLAVATDPEGSYKYYEYTNGQADGAITFQPVMKPGKYEIRAFFDDSTGDKTVRARQTFEVTAAPPVTASLDKETYKAGEKIKVTFQGMPGNERDWFSIAKADAADASYITYEYTRTATSGDVSLDAPDEPGAYEVRAYFDDSTGDKTVRARLPFKVE